jgi:hypothetical protein
MTPEEELKRLNRLIREFEAVFKSTKDPLQRERVTRELRKLKAYKEQLESFHEIDPAQLAEPEQIDELQAFPHLKEALQLVGREDSALGKPAEEDYQDREVYHLALYLALFEAEFLALLSETRLKMDFKHSLERDSFYHRFENLRRLLLDIKEDASRMDEYLGRKHEEELRLRSFKKKRNIILEADKFFRNLAHFAGALTEDIAAAGSICLNADDVLRFGRGPNKRLLEGLTVEQALARLDKMAKEVVSYLDVPQFEVQES